MTTGGRRDAVVRGHAVGEGDPVSRSCECTRRTLHVTATRPGHQRGAAWHRDRDRRGGGAVRPRGRCCRSTRSAPREVGLSPSASPFRKLDGGQPDRVPRRGGLPGRAADARVCASSSGRSSRVEKFPWVQVPGGRDRRGDRAGRRAAADRRQERGLQAGVRQLLEPRARSSSTAARRACSARCCRRARCVPIHPVAFLVHHRRRRSTACRSRPTSRGQAERRRADARSRSACRPSSCASIGHRARRRPLDIVGIVTALEGEPLPSGDIASRLGGFADIAAMEASNAGGSTATTDAEIIEVLLGSKNTLHNNYQDFQAFLDARRQDRPAARPAALRRLPAEPVPRARRDGADARREPGRGRGHQGASSACRRSTRRAPSSSSARSCGPATAASGRSRCAPASTRSTRACYAAEIVPTSILTLNWADGHVGGAQPRRAPVADRRQEPRGLRLPDRPAGADPRARHARRRR